MNLKNGFKKWILCVLLVSSFAFAVNLTKVFDSKSSPGFTTFDVNDWQVGTSYIESQVLRLEGSYNNSNAQLNKINYYALFSLPANNATGIRICNMAPYYNYQNCDYDYLTKNHDVTIRFLDSDWVITDMVGPLKYPPYYKPAFDATFLYGKVTLSKESIHGIINVGDYFELDNVGTKLVLNDTELSNLTGSSAIISFVNSNGTLLKKDKISQGATKDITVNGKTYKIRVSKIAPGYTFGAKWAEIAIISEQITLQDNSPLISDSGDYSKDWIAHVGWSYGKKENEGTLKSIWISNTKGVHLKAGQSFSIAKGNQLNLSYTGNGHFSLKTSPYQTTISLGEGESSSLSGYSIKVKEITENVGSNGIPSNEKVSIEVTYKGTTKSYILTEGQSVTYNGLNLKVADISVSVSCANGGCSVNYEKTLLEIAIS